MKRTPILLLPVLLLLILSPSSQAATVTGKVLDAETGCGLEYGGYVTVYEKIGEDSWRPLRSTHVSKIVANFFFDNLAAGTYFFMTDGPMYVSEIYDNTTLFEKKKTITLTTDQKKSLGTIKLKPLPIRLGNFQLTGSPVPAEGGTVQITCNVINDTASTKTLMVWPTVSASRICYNATRVNDYLEGAAPQSVKVGPNTTVTVSFSIEVPASAPSAPEGSSYVYMNCGYSKWKPLTTAYGVGSFYKLAASEATEEVLPQHELIRDHGKGLPPTRIFLREEFSEPPPH